jgi:hypothetical protein
LEDEVATLRDEAAAAFWTVGFETASSSSKGMRWGPGGGRLACEVRRRRVTREVATTRGGGIGLNGGRRRVETTGGKWTDEDRVDVRQWDLDHERSRYQQYVRKSNTRSIPILSQPSLSTLGSNPPLTYPAQANPHTLTSSLDFLLSNAAFSLGPAACHRFNTLRIVIWLSRLARAAGVARMEVSMGGRASWWA